MTRWTKKKVLAAVGTLKRHTDLSEALAEIGETPDALHRALRRNGYSSPGSYLRQDPRALYLHQEKRQDDKAAIRELNAKLSDLEKQLEVHRALSAADASIELPRTTHSKRTMTGVVLASDWHVEERVDPDSILGANEYNLDIAHQRIGRFFDAIVWNVRHHRADKQIQIDELVLGLIGDLITGHIHEELVEMAELAPIPTLIWLFPRLCSGIEQLVRELKLHKLLVVCSHGNHGRTTDKKRISTGYAHSFEWMLYNQMATHFKGDSVVSFVVTPSAHQLIKVYNTKIHFHHGDDVRFQGGVGGIAVPLLRAAMRWDQGPQRADVHCIGHFHTRSDFGRVVVNGSLIGYNPYAQSKGFSPEPPCQGMFFVDSERGKCMPTDLWV